MVPPDQGVAIASHLHLRLHAQPQRPSCNGDLACLALSLQQLSLGAASSGRGSDKSPCLLEMACL